MKIGRGSEEGVEVGPLIDGTQRDKVAELVTDAVGKGAKVLTGGEAQGDRGYFYKPTVLTDISDDAELLREEIFGPVAPVKVFTTDEEAIAAANDTEYGLVAYVYTRDLNRAFRVAEALETGMLGLNQGVVSNAGAPFGGVKASASAARAATRASTSTSRPSTSRWRSDMASTQSELKDLQRPLKAGYREEPETARITLTAKGGEGDTGVASCSVDLGRAIYAAEAHVGVGGAGTAACSGDLLLGALAACAQLTCQMVATAMGLDVRSVNVTVDGDLDLRGTLGLDREVGAGFDAIRLKFAVDAPDVSDEDLASLFEKTERYCTVLQTMTTPPPIASELVRA